MTKVGCVAAKGVTLYPKRIIEFHTVIQAFGDLLCIYFYEHYRNEEIA